jgi:tRNA threonylcarbamoyladenosine biosynthesis protein TsaE
MGTLISRSPEETLRLGEAWGRAAQSGWVIGLRGDLGAGKTLLVRGIAQGLGTPGRVHSPTFTLVNEYLGGRLPLFHLDLYRLERAEDIAAAGLEEFLSPAGVSVVEWAERWPDLWDRTSPLGLDSASATVRPADPEGRTHRGAAAPRHVRRVIIDILGETERRIRYEDSRA